MMVLVFFDEMGSLVLFDKKVFDGQSLIAQFLSSDRERELERDSVSTRVVPFFSLTLSFFAFSRHEVPVSSEKIKIVHIDDDLVVVNKPASIPVSLNF